MVDLVASPTRFEDLSDDVIISIIEYLPYDDSISIFGKLNHRLAWIIFDHPWIHYQFNVQMMDNNTLQEKISFLETIKLQLKVWTITLSPYSIFRSIDIFNQYSSIANFVNLQALCLINITLKEAETIFADDCLSVLVHLTHLRLIFSQQIEQTDGNQRLEQLLPRILTHSSLRRCTIHASQPLEFSQMELLSPIEYLDIVYCSFQSMFTLFKFSTSLRYLCATIVEASLPKEDQVPPLHQVPPLLHSLKLNLTIQSSDALTDVLKQFPKLIKLNIVSFLFTEKSIDSSWFQFITEHLPVLHSFQWQSPVPLQNCTAQLQSFNKWSNEWHLQEKTSPISDYYSQMKVRITKY